MKLIFEPHNGFGANDPEGNPWPLGYISEAPGRPIFEPRPIFEQSVPVLMEIVQQMIRDQPN